MNQPTVRRRWRRWWSFVLLSLFLLTLAIVAEFRFRPGIKVVVENRGETLIRSLTVHVTGNSYSLGDLAPGAATEVIVTSTGESDVAIEMGDSATRRRLNVGVYIEPGYRGTVGVSIKDGLIDHKSHKIALY